MASKLGSLKAIIDSANKANLERSIMPAPQRFFDPEDKAYKPFLEQFDYQPGGRYLEMGPDGPRDVTGEYPVAANISVGPDGKPAFKASQENLEAPPDTKGVQVKTNLFKKKAGWKWTKPPKGYDPDPDGSFPLISVEARGKHYYALETDFPEGVDLSRYASSSSEPRLRPTRKGEVTLGKKVGEISVRGKKHPVYDRAIVKTTVPIAAAGAAGLSSEEAEANPLLKIIDSGRKAGIEAYHGSPHDFPAERELQFDDPKDVPIFDQDISTFDGSVYQPIDAPVPEGARVVQEFPLGRFDSSKIGTGEGAQAYGQGLYLAGNEDVARGYRDQLKGNVVTRDDGVKLPYGKHVSEIETAIKNKFPKLAPDNVRMTAKSVVNDNLVPADVEGMGVFDSTGYKAEDIYLEGIRANKGARASKGSMYKVNIDADPDELLDWDAPLSEQKALLKKLDDVYGDHEIVLQQLGLDLKYENPTGMNLADALNMRRGSPSGTPKLLEEAGIKGIKYADAFTRHKPKDKRSNNYVIFDPRIIEISKKYGISIPLASAVIAGTMSPEEAQAMGVKSVATQGIRSLGETLEFDPRFDPRKREQEGLQSLRVDVLPRNESMVKPPIRLSDLEGEDFVTSMSDRTRAGGMIMGVNDVPLYRAVDLRGGQDFMFENPNQVWASAKVPSEKILEMARELQGQSGKDPIFIPWRMAPTGGDFSNMVGELMLGFASSNMNKTTKKAFDVAVRKYRTKGSMDKGVRKNAGLKIKEWPGVDDPRAVEIWRSTPDAVRKELMNMMDVNFRKKGGLSIGAARLATSDPTQLMSRDAGLQNVGRIYTGRDIAPSTHPSYPYAVPGEGIGALKGADEVTIFDLLPEARFGDAQKKIKDPANPTAQEMRALQMKPYGGTITENILRRIEERGVDVNSLTGLAPGALAFTLTSAGLLTPDEAAAGGLDEAAEVFGGTKGGMGVKSKKIKDDVAFKAAPKKESPGLPSLVGQLGLGAMSEIGGTIFGGAAGVDEYLRHSPAESIRDARKGTSEFVGGLYDAGPEAQQLGQEAVKGIAGIVGPTIDYAMEGPVMDDRGLNVLPLIAKALNMSYEGWKEIYDLLPEREQEAVISAADAFL